MFRGFGKYIILLITIQWVCSETTPEQPKKCFIPNTPQLQDLRFRLHPKNHTIELGSYVEEYEIVYTECNNNNKLQGPASLICQNGEWNSDFPTCKTYCDRRLLRGLSLRAICDNRDSFVECPEKILPGTVIHLNCAFGYTRNPKTAQILQCLPNGSFDKSPERCEHICGQIAPTSTTLTKDGIEIDSSVAPWHVAVYENDTVAYNYKCSGSIISPTIIISAASCFWDEANLLQKNYVDFEIIAGRSTSNYTTEQNLHSQLVKVEQIHIPVEYQGKEGRQKYNIAFLKLERPLKYSETVAPICLPTDLANNAANYVRSNLKGFTSGFGKRNELEKIVMTTLAYHDCIEKSPPDAPVADDKFCIYNTEGGLVCRGDSGAGFVTESKDLETNEVEYRLWGVVSDAPTTKNDCTRTGDQAYVAITNIFNTASEFKRKLAIARKEDKALF